MANPSDSDSSHPLARRPVKGERGSAAQRRTLDGPRQSASDTQSRLSLKDIELRVSLHMVLSHYRLLSTLKPTGKQLMGACPIHGGSNRRQFLVDGDLWHCFGDCEAGGKGCLSFVAAYERAPIERAAALIIEWFALKGPSAPPSARSKGMANNKPTHAVFIVEPGSDEKGFFHRVGAAWPHRSGRGLSIQLIPGMAVSGRLVLLENDEEERERSRAKAGE